MRKIIHCDFDCFYAAIEIRDNPALKGLPIAIGGSPNQRGVIATCSYEARDYGIHSAMASVRALKLCPELILIYPNMKKYKEASQQAHQIFKRYSQIIEPLSLDEAFLDVSNSELFYGSATLIAQALRQDIQNEIGVSASAGIAPNKFLAKIASDWHKPNGQFTITPDEIDTFVAQLAIGKIFGIGKVTERRMQKQGFKTCADLKQFSKLELAKKFGGLGENLYNLCRGIDEREVNTEHTRKSLSVENTYQYDLNNYEEGLGNLPELESELHLRYEKIKKNYTCVGIVIKIKFSDFTQTTAEHACDAYDSEIAKALLKMAFKRKNSAVRLMGLGLKLKPNRPINDQQMRLL